ncbi:hypothetical protein [Leucothrix pacifica]|uniref:Glycoside hydrolase family 42 N-terminal domain-containing protein n=1 Tax=Leucothrix pacifica TaxID=1247513 RepID=A0A317CPR4_9GAMM|nr:hypothetical protein [Leucothrix pacifica]PWR00497.1 hypothetical protein DKW60_01355 [Leucothrix pacifica]
MKKLKNLLFILILGVFIVSLSIALLLPDTFYGDLSDRLFNSDNNSRASNSATNGPELTTPKQTIPPRVTEPKKQPTSPTPPPKKPATNQSIGTNIEVVKGMDWRLPSYARRSTIGGLVSETRGPKDYIRGDFHIVRWDRTNPVSGKFDFSELQHQLNSRPGQQIVLRPEIYSRCETPAWALKQLRYTRNGSLIFWDQQYLELVKPYIQQLANFVRRNPQIVGVQLGIADGEYRGDCKRFELKDGWGEFTMNPQELLEAETDFGLTPALLESSTKHIVNAFVTAFGSNTHKLAFNNLEQFSWNSIAEPYNQRMPSIAKFVLDKGLGNRDGQVEHWMRYIHKVYGMQLEPMGDGTCSLLMDETVADRYAKRYWATENEIYGNLDYVLNEHGSYQNQPYRFLISSLRGLQMRRNYSLIFARAMQKIDHPVYKTQEFLRYLDKTMGKLRKDTPDLFILFGERYVADYRLAAEYPERKACQSNDRTAIRSFGRWITETSNSQPAMKIDMPESDKKWGQGFYLPNGTDYEYAARSSNEFSFNINEQLGKIRCPTRCNVVIKLTYKDDTKTTVWIETSAGETSKLTTKGDGKLKTASFTVELNPDNTLDRDDFRVKSGQGNLSLMLLRLNLLNP